MGITSQTERGERREMVILLILLLSTAFGRPSSDRDVGTEIGNQLNELAHRTVMEDGNVRSLLEALDNDATSRSHIITILLKAAIGRMKLLMEETKEKLKAAKNKYEEATLAYRNPTEARKIYEKFDEDKEYTEKMRSICKIASWFTFGACSLIHHFVNEVPLERARLEVEDLETMSEKLTERAKILIDKWAKSAELVRKNID